MAHHPISRFSIAPVSLKTDAARQSLAEQMDIKSPDCIEMLYVLATSLNTRKWPMDDLLSVVSFIFEVHLNPEKIPARLLTSSGKFPTAMTARLWHATRAFQIPNALYLQHVGDDIAEAILKLIVVEHMTTLWKWLEFFHSFYAAVEFKCVDGQETLYRSASRSAILQTLSVLSRDHALQKVLARSSFSILPMLVDMWMRESKEYRPSPTDIDSNPATVILSYLYMPEWTGTILAAAGDRMDVAGASLSHLRREISSYLPSSSTKPDFNRLNCACLMVNQLIDHDTEMRNAFLSRHSLRTITQAFVFLASRVQDPAWEPYHPMLPTCVQALGCHIFRLLESTGDPSYAIQTIDVGLLPALLQCHSMELFDSDKPDFRIHFFSVILPPFTIYLSVLRSLSQSITKIEEQGLEAQIPRDSPAWIHWNSLKTLATERADLYNGDILYVTCDNENCTNGSSQLLPRCSGCFGTVYCSTQCQKLAWKAHKNDCQKLKTSRQEGRLYTPSETSPSDLAFIRQLTQHVLAVHAEEITTSWRNKNDKMPGITLVFAKGRETFIFPKRPSMPHDVPDSEREAMIIVILPWGTDVKAPQQDVRYVSAEKDDFEGDIYDKLLRAGINSR